MYVWIYLCLYVCSLITHLDPTIVWFGHRYLGITKDFSHRKWTVKRVMLNLLIVWVISFLIYVPSASSLRLRRKYTDCYEYWKKPDQYFHSAFLLLVEYIIPLSVIGFCNYKIIKVIKDRSKNMPQMQVEEFEKRDKEQRKTVRYSPASSTLSILAERLNCRHMHCAIRNSK